MCQRSTRDETPDSFLFSAKAPQRIMESRAPSKTGHQVEDFIGGIVELGDKLGPLVWQFDKGKRIDAGEFAAFVELLPREHALLVASVNLIAQALVAITPAGIQFDGRRLPAPLQLDDNDELHLEPPVPTRF